MCQAIIEDLERGVTILRGEGGYTGAERIVLMTTVGRRQLVPPRQAVSDVDPDAFMVINPSHEVLGEGFKPLTWTRVQPPRPGALPTELE